MRELEVAATKEVEGNLSEGVGQEEEEQLMEERKKRKEDKKKKDTISKKAAEQKNKVPDQIQSQPQPVNGTIGISTATSIQNNNAKQPTAINSQLQQTTVPRYPPREVPPRFRQQEQKHLLKRGQQFPAIAANLGLVTVVVESGSKTAVGQEHPLTEEVKDSCKNQPGMPPIRDMVSHSPNQLDLNLGPHYESSHWGPVSSNVDSGTNWDKIIVDGTDKEAWPSITDNSPELTSECMDIDSATNSGPEKSHLVPFADSVGEMDTIRNGIAHSSQSKLLVGSNSNNAGNGSINGPWGMTHGAMISTCQDGPDSKSDSRHNRINAWGTVNTSANGVNNPSTLNMNGNHGAWPVLDSNGHTLKGSNNSGTNVPNITIGQVSNNRSINPKAGSSSSWGNHQENCDSEVNGTQKVSYSGQPQNLNTEMTGPNNTTNFMTSSLPNSAGLMQTNELPNSTGHGAWCVSNMNHSPLHTPSITNGTSIPHLSNGEEKNGGSYGTTWSTSGSTYSGEKSSVPKGQANGDTVNATIMQPGINGPNCPNYKINGNKGVWESGTVNSQNMHWGNGGTSGGNRRGWGNPAQNTGTNISNGEWNKMPSTQHSNEGENIENCRKAPNTWKSAEEDNVGHNPTGSKGNEANNVWAKSTGMGESEGSVDSTGSQSEQKNGTITLERRKTDQQTLLQSIVNKGDLDPRVLCNTGWGQTPIRQNTAWNIEAASPRSDRKTDNGTEAWGSSVSKTSNSGGWVEKPNPNSNDTSSVSGWGDPKSATGWGDAKGSISQGDWEDQFAATTGMVKSNQSWGNGKEDKSTWNDAQKVKQGWGAHSGDNNKGENSKNNHWGVTKSGNGNDNDRSMTGWNEHNRSNSWGSGNVNTSNWADTSKNGSTQGWGEPTKPNTQGNNEASKCGPAQMESEMTSNNSTEWNKKPDTGSWGAQATTNKSGWLGGPMATPAKEEDSTGWEEPSPESIRRKMEIDDGTAAWGDPNQYKYNVNRWGKNTSSTSSSAENQPQLHLMPPPSSAMPNKENSNSSGWGETWPDTPSPAVNNGTSAWGKPIENNSSWGDPSNEPASSGWNHTPIGQQAPCKPGPKSMQEGGWCGEEMSVSRHSNWEDDDVEIGMWNSNASQENNASLNWPPYMKKMPTKGTTKNGNKQEENWINPFVKQFNNLAFSRDAPEDSMQSNKMDLPGVRMDMEKTGLGVGDYNRAVGKAPGPRHISKESSMDHNPYFDKDNIVAEESQNMQFISNQNMKLPPLNSALPTQSLGSFTGLGMPNISSVKQNGNSNMYGVGNAAQARGAQQPPAQALSSSQPNLRAQVPPPIIPPQVPPSLLKYPPNNGGLNPLFGPQQVAMLNQLSQLNQLTQLSQISQLQRLLAQQQKVQNPRGVSSGTRQQQEQQVRNMGLHQQSRQYEPNLLMKQPVPQSPQSMHHQPPMKSYMENVLPHSTPEMPKVPSPISAFGGFSLGLNSNVNMELGSMKEPQSRLRKWTTVDSMSSSAISSGFRLEDSPFGSYDFMNSSNSPSSPPGSIGDGWPSAKSPNGSSSVNWPPEFRPGEPWKGYPNIDPETDPYVTPGSVINNLSINTVRGVDHLRDRNNGSSSSLNTALPSNSAWSSIRASNYSVSHSSTAQSTSVRNSDPKSAWSPGSVANTSLAHELWKVPLPSKNISAPSRPPPGLTGQKPPLSTWDSNSLRLGGGWGNSDSRYTPGSTWSDNSSGRITNWLVLKNLTPQIDGSTLRTLCMQHGPLITFHLNLPHGTALVRYSSKEEVVKAQKSLHMCVLGNTTILAEFASEEEISRFFAQGQSMTPSPSWQSMGSGHSRLGSLDSPHNISNRGDINHWNSPGASGSGDLHGTSLWGTPNYSTSLWGSPNSENRGLSSPSPVGAYLPDHLSGEPM
ncbi:trinucleotide repeat-containing gene 6A protein isoform X2 [Bombina bombina]|uniref:trinucleotide repeat-containing gene 6A protein isoform X2 n=1 Tax=Bombina bombina TaxID=8345 RepID=UPI00235A56B4|nr:trinucleotide repeat-containing gene 6A protein isoform X2 [Bombina bombina]